MNALIQKTTKCLFSSNANINNFMSSLDHTQKEALNENLILVDENDNPVGSISKINAHVKALKNEYPHRAFSVFLFNDRNEMLLQQRSHKKFTFPGLWSNTCCSHPLNYESEKETKFNIGIKRAAVRRMKWELGVDTNEDDYRAVEKILYRADSNEIFEEFELDYILIAKIDLKLEDLEKNLNTDEVLEVGYFKKESLLEHIANGMKITPWFGIMIKTRIDAIFEYAESLNHNIMDEHNIKLNKYV